jgi:mRNA-degrading endonuclease YafQ of YafQ-DinJ toxin-antitoxin module
MLNASLSRAAPQILLRSKNVSSRHTKQALLRSVDVSQRSFSTSLQVLQPSIARAPSLYERVKQLKQELSRGTAPSEVHPMPQWSHLKEPSSETIASILGDSPVLESTSVKPPVLEMPPKHAQLYEEIQVFLMEAKGSLTETVFAKRDGKSLEQLAIGAASINDFNFLWKVVDYVAKDHWHLFSPQSYRVIVQAALETTPSSNQVLNELVDLFRHHIPLHPRYKSSEMLSVILFFLSSLASVQPIRALRLYKHFKSDFAHINVSTFDSALMELQLVSQLPYPDLLCDHVDKVRLLIDTIEKRAEKSAALSKVANSLVHGLVKAELPEAAVDVLLSGNYFNLSEPSSAKDFIQAYRTAMNSLVKIHISVVEKLLSLLTLLPQNIADTILHHERFEWVLKAHAHSANQRLTDDQALQTLETMSLVSGVTSDACNSYLHIVARNASSPRAKALLESQVTMLFEKFSFLPNFQTFKLLAEHCASPLEVMEVFDLACRSGQVDAQLYSVMFNRVFAASASIIGNPKAGDAFRLKSLISQCRASNLLWTPQLLASALAALNKHRLYADSVTLFQSYLENGEIMIESKCANLAISAAQRLGGAHVAWAKALAVRMEQNMHYWHGIDWHNNAPLLDQAISATTYRALNLPNSALAKEIANSLPTRTQLSIESLCETSSSSQPWMLFDSRTLNLLSLSEGYQSDLYARITAEPFNIVPTDQTHLVLIRHCIRSGSWDGLVFLFMELLRLHPHSIDDALVDEVMAPLAASNHPDLVKSIRDVMVAKGLQLPPLENIMSRFRFNKDPQPL